MFTPICGIVKDSGDAAGRGGADCDAATIGAVGAGIVGAGMVAA